jgi:hypothetical protein
MSGLNMAVGERRYNSTAWKGSFARNTRFLYCLQVITPYFFCLLDRTQQTAGDGVETELRLLGL